MDRKRFPSTSPCSDASTQAESQGEDAGSHECLKSAVGSVLGDRFELLDALGVGAFGEVYRARDRHSSGVDVAVKRLRRPGAHGLYRFKREFRALCETRHPNLVELHELFLDEDGAFFSMEMVSGTDFLRYVRPTGALDPERLRTAARGLCSGVCALHDSGHLHRDLKPNNVLVTAEGRVVIVDFGLATAFAAGNERGTELGFAGTPAYAAPEQLSLGQVGPAADWYAVGTMLYEALSGQLPFEASFTKLAQLKCRAPEGLPEIDDGLSDLRALCLSLLEPDPAQRAGESEVRGFWGTPSPGRSAAARELPFVGRSSELEALHAQFARVERGGAAIAAVFAPSGLGKTTLVDRFAETLRERRGAIVLRSRCYVNEELAYQAIDGCVDALSHYLCAMPRAESASVLPRDARSLARVFPVLDRVEEIHRAPQVRTTEDRLTLRERAAAALRELFARLSDRTPVVLIVDDVQWDDADSAWLLARLFAEPDPPALMLVVTCRSDLRDQSQLLCTLDRSPAKKHVMTEISLPGLSSEEIVELALSASDEALSDPKVAARIAAESAGHPLFALELARFNALGGAPRGPAELSLDAAICARVRKCSPAAQRLLEIACVAGHPLRYASAVVSAEADVEALRELSAQKLIVASGSGDDDSVHVYHDRVREALLVSLAPSRVRELHGRIAGVLEREPNPRFDLVVEHYLAADAPARAARFALPAADRAGEVLAFHRLPDLLTLALTDPSQPERGRLYVRLAESYALVGRTADAARAYRDAAEFEPDFERRWELTSMAMWQALLAQDFDLGFALLRELDAPERLGVRATHGRVLVSALRYLRWRVFGPPRLRPCPRPPSPDERRRLTLAFRVATALIGEHADKAGHASICALQRSAKQGDTATYAIFMSMMAASDGLITGRPSSRAERFLRTARELVEHHEDRGPFLMVVAAEAAYSTALGNYEHAQELLTSILETPFPSTPFGAFLRIFIHKIYATLLFWRGDIARTRAFADHVIMAARKLSDLRSEFGLRALSAFRLLAEDDAESAYSEWSDALAQYPRLWTFREPIWGIVPALYAGRTDRAEHAIEQSRRLLLFWDAYSAPGRTFHLWAWGTVAAARLAAGERSWRLRLRLRIACALTQWGAPRAVKPLARSLRAARAFLTGNRAQGVVHLAQARELFVAQGLRMFAACASQVLARLSEGDAADQHATYAREVFTAEKIRCPDKWVRALLPGCS